jgi:hypothetical protein
MTQDRDIERFLDQWLSDGPNQAPDRVIDVVADRIGRQSQRPAWRLAWRTIQMNRTFKAAAALAAIIVVGLVGLRLSAAGTPSVGGPPASSTVSPAVQSASAAVIPKACDLATPAEVGAALNLSSAISSGPASGSNGDVDYCIYRAAGTEVLGATYRNNGGGPVFDVWNKGAGVQSVPGLGDKAIWDPGQSTLFILKGSRLLSIQRGGASAPIGLEAAKAVGTVMAPRM